MQIVGYKIERQIGQGGMAMVYQAVQESLQRPVALKVMNPLFAETPEFSERFLNEGRMLASLRHTNIITIYDIGVSDGWHYISMEYVDGGDLRQRIQSSMLPETALDYLLTLGSCLKAAHEAHIVHRDVKPVNILFRRDGTLLLTDFGIAKHLGNHKGLTATGSMVGSPYYLSPEQILGRPLDGRADIYSLGIVLYEMLVGEKPFEGDSEIDVALKHIEVELPPLPQDLVRFQPLLDRMTAKKPEDRFRDAVSMLQAAQYMRDTGRWNDTDAGSPTMSPVGEQTVILANPRQQAPVSAGAEQSPEGRDDGGRLSPNPRHLVAGKSGKRTVVVGMLVLTGGLVAGGLISSQNEVTPPQATSSQPAQREESAQRAPAQREAPAPPESPAYREESAPLAQREAAPPELPAQREAPVPPELPAHAEAPAQPEPLAYTEEQTQIETPVQRDQLLLAAQTALSDNRLTLPDNHSAYYYYQQVLELDPGNSQATAGFSLIADRYFTLARKAFEKGEVKKARHYVKLGLSVKGDHAELLSLNDRLTRQERHSSGSARPAHDRLTRQERSSDDSTRPQNVFQAVGGFFKRLKVDIGVSPREERGHNQGRPASD